MSSSEMTLSDRLEKFIGDKRRAKCARRALYHARGGPDDADYYWLNAEQAVCDSARDLDTIKVATVTHYQQVRDLTSARHILYGTLTGWSLEIKIAKGVSLSQQEEIKREAKSQDLKCSHEAVTRLASP